MLGRWHSLSAARLRHTQVNERSDQSALEADRYLRLLSFNIQVGNSTERYHHYLTRGWQHVLPHPGRMVNLQRIGDLLSGFDLVALQEVDGGSLRSGYLNQVEYLAQLGDFPYWYQQLNRNLGPIAKHSNGMLSRLRPDHLEDHALPGPPGRGVILARFGQGDQSIAVLNLHLALGAKTRARQLAYIRELVSDYRYLVLMGDMNTHAMELLENSPLRDLNLVAPQACATFPSWRPERCLDHILLSQDLQLGRVEVLSQPISDHLPVAVEIRLPDNLNLMKA